MSSASSRAPARSATWCRSSSTNGCWRSATWTMSYGHGIAEWSLSLVPHKILLVSLTGALVGLNFGLVLDRLEAAGTVTQQCLRAGGSGMLTGVGALCRRPHQCDLVLDCVLLDPFLGRQHRHPRRGNRHRRLPWNPTGRPAQPSASPCSSSRRCGSPTTGAGPRDPIRSRPDREKHDVEQRGQYACETRRYRRRATASIPVWSRSNASPSFSARAPKRTRRSRKPRSGSSPASSSASSAHPAAASRPCSTPSPAM